MLPTKMCLFRTRSTILYTYGTVTEYEQLALEVVQLDAQILYMTSPKHMEEANTTAQLINKNLMFAIRNVCRNQFLVTVTCMNFVK